VISLRTSEVRKPLVKGTPRETSRSTVSAPTTTVGARKCLVLSAPGKKDHSVQRKPDIERDPIETEDVISLRTSEVRKPLIKGTPRETSRSTVSAPTTSVEARKRLVLSAPGKISGSTATAANTDDTKLQVGLRK
jgi:hypothetical protein